MNDSSSATSTVTRRRFTPGRTGPTSWSRAWKRVGLTRHSHSASPVSRTERSNEGTGTTDSQPSTTSSHTAGPDSGMGSMSKAAGLEYEERGDGEPVLLVHGAAIADSFLPLSRQPSLDGFRVIWYRRRGYGGSDRVPGPFS